MTIAGLLHSGVSIMASPYLMKHTQYRKPHTKNRRIRKKWSKRAHNWRHEVDPGIYHWGDHIVAHPATIARLKQQAQEVL